MGLKKYLDIWTVRKISGDETRTDFERDELDAYIKSKLQKTVEYARANSVFYEKKYSSISNDTQDFIKFFESLPFSTPDELRSSELDFLCVRPGEISRIVTLDTGGTTGVPKRVYFTEEDQQLTVDYFENGMQLLVDKNDKILILMPAKITGSIGKLLSKGLRNFGADTVDYGLPQIKYQAAPEENDQELGKILDIMIQQKITSIVALPTHLKMLAEYVLHKGIASEAFAVKNVLLSAEYVSDEVVNFIGTTLGCKVYEHYGMTEMGLGCAVSCGQGEGYHVREIDLYIEIIDPDTGEIVNGDEVGEVVFTTLTRKGMPFIRYRTGDYSHWITQACACGSKLKRLAKVGPRDVVKGYLL